MALELPGLPVEEQMVDNWGQPTSFMQLRWQELTEKLAGQETTQDTMIGQLATQGSTLSTTVSGLATAQATLAATVTNLGTVTSNLGTVTSNLSTQTSKLSTVTSNLETVTDELGAAQDKLEAVVLYLLELALYQSDFNAYVLALGNNFLDVWAKLCSGDPIEPPLAFPLPDPPTLPAEPDFG